MGVMPLYRDTTTDTVADYPENIGEHRVLGRNLVLLDTNDTSLDEDRVTDEVATPTQHAEPVTKPTRYGQKTADPSDSKETD